MALLSRGFLAIPYAAWDNGSHNKGMSDSKLDHLVILAATLDEGVAWCEATLGVVPGPGGSHPLMGTHNRLVKIATPTFPRAYLEVIAIDAGASASRAGGNRRWFDMDDQALRERVLQQGPKLIHWVASVRDVSSAGAALRMLGIDRGPPVTASRQTGDGLLSWQITVRGDGQRLLDGTLPTLIQWGNVHPADTMADTGVGLQALQLQHPQAELLQAALQGIGVKHVAVRSGLAELAAVLHTPLGRVVLRS